MPPCVTKTQMDSHTSIRLHILSERNNTGHRTRIVSSQFNLRMLSCWSSTVSITNTKAQFQCVLTDTQRHQLLELLNFVLKVSNVGVHIALSDHPRPNEAWFILKASILSIVNPVPHIHNMMVVGHTSVVVLATRLFVHPRTKVPVIRMINKLILKEPILLATITPDAGVQSN